MRRQDRRACSGSSAHRYSWRGARRPFVPVPVSGSRLWARRLRGRATRTARRRYGYVTASMGCGATRTSPTGTRETGCRVSHLLNWPPSVCCGSCSACPTASRRGGPRPHRLHVRHGHGTGRPPASPQRAGRLPRPSRRRRPRRPPPRPRAGPPEGARKAGPDCRPRPGPSSLPTTPRPAPHGTDTSSAGRGSPPIRPRPVPPTVPT